MVEDKQKKKGKVKMTIIVICALIIIFIIGYTLIKPSFDNPSDSNNTPKPSDDNKGTSWTTILIVLAIIGVVCYGVYYFLLRKKTGFGKRKKKGDVNFGTSISEVKKELLYKHAMMGDIRFFKDSKGKLNYNEKDYEFGSHRWFMEKDGNPHLAMEFALYSGPRMGYHEVSGLMTDIDHWKVENYSVNYHYAYKPDVKQTGYPFAQPASVDQRMVDLLEAKANAGKNIDQDVVKHLDRMNKEKEAKETASKTKKDIGGLEG